MGAELSRLVYPPHIAAQLLARQALGTQHLGLATRDVRFQSRCRRPVVARVLHAHPSLHGRARARYEFASPHRARPF